MKKPILTLSELEVSSFLTGTDYIRAGADSRYRADTDGDDCDPNSGVVIISPTGP
ncbi:MAG: hypothetical protein WBB45_19735 [Cyclobacteriaceae bacterium]